MTTRKILALLLALCLTVLIPTGVRAAEQTGKSSVEADGESFPDEGAAALDGEAAGEEAESVSLYATWTIHGTIRLIGNGGVFSSGRTTKDSSYSGTAVTGGINNISAAVPYDRPTRTGYTFGGWLHLAEDPNLGNGTTLLVGSKDANRQGGSIIYLSNGKTAYLVACWDKIGYTVQYMHYDGRVTKQTKYHSATNSPAFYFLKPEAREGYTFLGYATSPDTAGAAYTAGGKYEGNAPLTLYEVWEPHTYTVTYHDNGGEGAPAPQTKTHDEELAVSGAVPVRPGYRFLGWSEDPDAKQAEIQPGDLLKDRDTDLYAVWRIILPANSVYISGDGSGAGGGEAVEELYFCAPDSLRNFNIVLEYPAFLTYTDFTLAEFSGTPYLSEREEGTNHILEISYSEESGGTFDISGSELLGRITYHVSDSSVHPFGVYSISVRESDSFFIKADGVKQALIYSHGQNFEYLTHVAEGVQISGPARVSGPVRYTAVFTPENTTDQSVRWEVDNSEIASIDEDGLLTPHRNGVVTVTVRTRDGSGLTESIQVEVTGQLSPIDSISVSDARWDTPFSGDIHEYILYVPPDQSSISLTAEFGSGTVLCEGYGYCFSGISREIPVSSDMISLSLVHRDSGYDDTRYTLSIIKREENPVIPVTGITLNKAALSLTAGGAASLAATVIPSNATNKNVTWTSSNPEIASVENGTITANGAGAAIITVITEDGGKTASVTVTVNPKPAVLSSLELSGEAAAIEGMPLDLSGLVVTAVYSSGERSVITDYTVSGFNASQTGDQTVFIGYGGKTAALPVTVAARSVTGIAIQSLPTKTAYTVGDPLNTDGLSIVIFYNNATKAVRTDGFSVSGYDAGTLGMQSILVTYEDFKASFTVTVGGSADGEIPTKPVLRIESVEGGKRVTLSAPQGTIYYTTDGSVPSTGSQQYDAPFTVTEPSTAVKAIAVSGTKASPITSGVIKVSRSGGVDASPGSGTVPAGTIVTLCTATAGADIYYTHTDEAFSKTSGAWRKYSGAIVIGQTQTIRTVAVKDGYANSEVTSLRYEVPAPSGDNVVISLGSVTVAGGDTASVPLYLFTDTETTEVNSFRISLRFDERSFERIVSITPAEGINPAHLFTSSSGGTVNLLYQGEPVTGGGEICTLNFTTLSSTPEGTKLDIEVNLDNSSITTGAAGGSSLTAVNAVITLTAARVIQAEGEITYTDTKTGQTVDRIEDAVSEIEANVTIDSGSVEHLRGTAANVCLVVYDCGGRMASMDLWRVDLSDPAFMFIQTVTIPEGTDVGAIKIMVLSDQMTPLMAAGKLSK